MDQGLDQLKQAENAAIAYIKRKFTLSALRRYGGEGLGGAKGPVG